MKRMSVLLSVTIGIVILCLFLPQITVGTLSEVEVIQPSKVEYYDKITASGKIEEIHQSEISCSIPVVASEVYVGIGDSVNAGDVIAQIDFDQTKQALMSLASLSQYLPEEAAQILSAIDLNELDFDKLIPSQIIADDTGIVSNLNITEGAIVTPTETIATIADLSTLRAVIAVPEEYAADVKTGQEVVLKVSALDNKKYHGIVDIVAPTAYESLVGTSKETVMNVYVSIEDQDADLKSGYSVNGTIALGEEEQILTVPYEAVNQQENGSEYVYLYENGKAKMRVIATGHELEDGVEVTGGLSGGEWVIENNSEVKRDGVYVNLKGIADD
jgi:multidrug efflux pump subunit AcrA (membrane-fusion protein)